MTRSIAACVLSVFALVTAARADKVETKYLVQVHLPTLEAARDLSAAGFDVAGVNRKASLAGVVVTDAEMRRLRDLGWSFTVERSNADPLSVQALSDYTDPTEFAAFLDAIVATYPTLTQKVLLNDNLFEGHDQWALHITADVSVPNDRPAFILDSQHHAREVMTTEIAKDMIEYLTSNYATDPDVQRWLDNLNIWVVGSVNPDGASYVFTNDNMWRKNRHPSCAVDPNRNYSFAWGSCNGSSANCSDETFRGIGPTSEPEAQSMTQFYDDVRPFFALSYHTYSELILFPYGCQNSDENAAFLETGLALKAILVNDNGQANQYPTGPIWSTIYLVDGGSVDTSYANFGVYAYSIEANCCSFQPDYATWRNITVQRQRTAWQFFLNRTLDGPQVRGKITDATTGTPLVANVAVQEVVFTHGELPRRSDSNGNYHWLAQSGQTYHLTFTKPGYCSMTQEVAVGTGAAVFNPTLVQPTPPATVAAVGAEDGAIDVSWSPAIQATKYRVLRSLDAGGPYQEIALVDAPTTTFHDTGLSGQVPYHYVVRALQPCESQNSAEAVGQTTGACTVGPHFDGLASVTNAGATTCTLDLDWSAAAARCAGGVSYRVYRDTVSPVVPSAGTLIASGLAGTSWSDADALANGGTYYYLVRAVDASNGADDGNGVTLFGNPTGPSSVGTWTDDAGDTVGAQFTLAAPWSVSPTGGKTGPKVYRTGTYTNNLCSAMTSPTISVQASSVLSFASKYDIETGWDAAIVEIATGPTFSTWSRLTTVNYPDSLSNTGNACGFPKTLTGTVFSHLNASPVYPATNFSGSLAAYAGQDVKLRWRLGTDSTGTGQGVWVDDLSVTNAVFRQVCATGVGTGPGESGALLASRGAGTSVDLAYAPACGASDDVVYWGTGPIVGGLSWTGSACGLGTSGTGSFDPGDPAPGAFFYFVVVGQNASGEGSYGQAFDGVTATERPQGVGVGACPMPQDLTGNCP